MLLKMEVAKLRYIFAAILLICCLLFWGCTGNSTVQPPAVLDLTPSQKQAIEKEVTNRGRMFFVQVEKLDIDSCMTFFENTNDFWAVNPDGSYTDYNGLKKVNGDAFSQITALSTTLKKEAVRVLSASVVLYTFFAKQQFTLKTGETFVLDNIAGSMLFAKINGAWKATWYHESALPPVTLAPQK
ncbi:MAG TPA: nuclear transport factor 2 family protein [Ferruginibacter sp.]|nr:nuclear transport factor 2 family protein [Ferruginibacter sp.]HMP22124.1 nuclear transport factor 2 family protein [Ferruginibacter sp.]